MSVSSVEGKAARVRWLLAGAFSPAPAAKSVCVGREDFGEALSGFGLRLAVEVVDRLSSAEKRTIDIGFSALGDFKIDGVIEACPELRDLKALVSDLTSNDPAHRPSMVDAKDRIERTVGAGKLSAAVEQALTQTVKEPAPAAPPQGKTDDNSRVDRIFSQTEVRPPEKSAAVAISKFVASMRAEDPAGAYKSASGPAKAAAAVIESALRATAADVLRDPRVSGLEGAWRGARLVLDSAPREGDLDIIILDSTPTNLPRALEEALSSDAIEWPDAFFLVDPVSDIELLRRLADLGEGLSIPVVVTLAPEAFEAARRTGASDSLLRPPLGDQLKELRATSAARWLALCVNRAVVASEGRGEALHVAFCSPAAAGAAMLASSYRDTGAFARVFGQGGGLVAPAVWQPPEAKDLGAIPLETFLSIQTQAELAAQGITGFGSGRNSDRVLLSTWPTLCGAPDAMPLPAQLLVGRIVRFCQWVRDQLTTQTTAEEVRSVFEAAGQAMLFASMSAGATLTAEIKKEEGQPPQVVVSARVSGALAGLPLSLTFALPLRGPTGS